MGEFLASCGALTQSTFLRTHQNNGARKFGRPAAFQAIEISPATAQGWVIQGKWIEFSALFDGTFTVVNSRNN
jgi:hypothetical protein